MQIITRNDAISQKYNYYFTGIPCKNGHISKRKVLNYGCCECDRLPTLARAKRHYALNVEEKKIYARKYYVKNKKRQKELAEVWRRKNQKKINKNYLNRYHDDSAYRIRVICRRMLNRCLEKTKTKRKCNTWKMLGYEPKDLIEHIEKLFSKGMSWDNYGEWHIDHKRPLDSFVKEGIFDISRMNALDNLQPLWAYDNISKGAKWKSI